MTSTLHAVGFGLRPDNSASDLRLPLREPPLVLCFGNDATLLSYRTEVLKLAGFEVIPLSPAPHQPEYLAQLCGQQRPAAAIACHTLTREQRIALAQDVRAACSSTKLLALTAGYLQADEAAAYDLLVDNLDGPAALIKTLTANL